jgi:hypothetical protein
MSSPWTTATRASQVSATPTKGYDGYALIVAYLGKGGWFMGRELRPGSQHANKGLRHPAKRRRLSTVMQELMTMACRLVHSGRQ